MISRKLISTAIAACCMVAVGGVQAEVREQSFRFATANPKGHPIPAGGEKFGELLAQRAASFGDEALRTEHGAHSRIQWLGDASIAPGDVKVESGGAEIDGGLDKRWRRAVAALGLVSTWYDGDKA